MNAVRSENDYVKLNGQNYLRLNKRMIIIAYFAKFVSDK